MRICPKHISYIVVVAVLLSGCQSATLIDLNGSYIDLIKQQREIDTLVDDGLGPGDAATIRTGLQTQFANIGDEASRLANAAGSAGSSGSDADRIKARRNEASFLSLAVRSYLSSGRIADHKAVAPAQRGIAVCRGLTGLQRLPTTCGYFHIAEFVGAHNETIRAIRPVFDRARALTAGQKLTTDEGRALEAATRKIVALLSALTDTGEDPSKINWADAAKGLKTNFTTQQTKFLCNAIRLQARIINAAFDPAWNAAEVQTQTKRLNDQWVEKLSRRPAVGFRRSRDCSGNAQL